VEDLQKLWKGVSTRDVLQPEAEPFKFCADILYCTHDYPGLGVMSSRVTSGYNACVHCDKEHISKKLIHKVGFFGHRRFLPKNHPSQRNRKKLQFVGSISDLDSTAPVKFSAAELKEHLEKVRNVKPGKPAAVTAGTKRKREEAAHKKKKADKVRMFYKSRSILWDLLYWCDLELRHNNDVMHLEKNICDNIIGTLLKMPSKTKDSVNARIDCVNYKVQDKLQPHDKHSEHYDFKGVEFSLSVPKMVLPPIGNKCWIFCTNLVQSLY
jgi:hypothetical protein